MISKKMIMLQLAVVVSLFLTPLAHAGLFSEDKSPEEQRKEIQAEQAEILGKILEKYPDLKGKIEKAPGYATFSTVNVNLLLLATARGTGLVIDNTNKRKIYMNALSVGGGIGAGIKDLNVLIIFNKYETLDQFVTSGWQFGVQADASLKSGDKGAAVGESASVSETGTDTSMSSGLSEVTNSETSMEIYKITEAGISAQATIGGVKFSRDDKLNQ